MLKIEVINTGTELLIGSTLNTHGAWIGERLLNLGLRVARQVTVPDGVVINEALREGVNRADVLIVTGGLGPTSDDITREACAEVLQRDIIEDEAALRSIKAYLNKRGRKMADDNRRQAQMPVGGEILPNNYGTAPGIYLSPRMAQSRPCAIFLLPGPPSELRPMFQEEVLPRLKALSGIEDSPTVLELKFTGVGESAFHQKLDENLAKIEGLEYGYCARPGEVDLRLIGEGEAVNKGCGLAQQHFSEQLVSVDGSSLEEVVVSLLKKKEAVLALAESCTGGLIAQQVTNVPGASEVFEYGFVTYANAAKSKIIGVDGELLKKYGAVSPQVAEAMAEGALQVSGADYALAVTGIAGPGGGSEEKPVGTVYVGLAQRGAWTVVQHCFMPTSRQVFRQLVSQVALDMLRKALLKLYN